MLSGRNHSGNFVGKIDPVNLDATEKSDFTNGS